jgi:hypothetical protein
MLEREDPALPVSQRCRSLAVSRSAVYRKPAEVSAEDDAINGAHRSVLSGSALLWLVPDGGGLTTQGHFVNRKRVQGLMRLLALMAIGFQYRPG